MLASRRIDFTPWMLAAALLPLCALLGTVVALGSQQMTLLAIGGVAGLLLLLIPSALILTLLLALGFVGVGVAMYYFGLGQLAWLPYALSMFLWIKLPIDALMAQPFARLNQPPRSPLPLFVWFLLAFFVIAIVSTALNQTPFINWLVGGKNFLFVWSIAFLVASGAISERYLKAVWLGLLGIAVLQMPFAALQHFTTVAIGGHWDAVVGTFGGNPESGGASGSLAIFVSIAIGAALAFAKNRQISLTVAIAVCLAGIATLALAETKIFVVLVPVMVALVLMRDIRRRPAFVLTTTFAVLVSGVAISALYLSTYYAPTQSRAHEANLDSYIDYVFRFDARPDFVNRDTGEVSRVGAPLLWSKLAGEKGVDKLLVGYGMTASRASQTVGYGAAAKQFQFMLTTSSLTVLLWDTGLIGALCFLLTLALAAATAWKLSARPWIPLFHRTALEISAGALAVCLLSCGYNNAMVDGPSLQIFLAFVIGYVLYWARHRAVPRPVADQ